MITKEDLASPLKPTWCPGCGDTAIWLSLKNALIQLGLKQEEVVIVYGIGCSGNMCNVIRGYGFEGLHGRALPVAEAIKMTNPRLKLIVVAGDGDTLGEGLNHFITACRGNHDVTLIIHDNRVYGLTTGQAAPTSPKGYKSKSTPDGTIETPLKPLALALAADASWISRGFSADPLQLTQLIVDAVKHRGFSIIDVLQNCATFNKVNDITWFKEHTYKASHDPKDKAAAYNVAQDQERLATGLIYTDGREPYDADLQEHSILNDDLANIDLTETMEEFV